MNKKKLTSLFLSIMMVVSLFSATLASAESAESKFADLYGHWAKPEVEAWAAQGLVDGYSDGTFKPNNSITRAELMTLVNNGFGFINKGDVRFADVNGGEWYVKEIALAVEAGYIEGYEADNTVQPKGEITRQEMAMVISRLLELDANAAAAADFSDAAGFPNWSKGAIGAVAAAGYMKGYEDKSFAPTKSITRAEAVATLSRLGNYITAAGTYDDLGTVSGNLIVTVPNVIVKGATVNGDLIVTEGVAEGDATFEDVTVKGDTKINGGGVNTVFFINSTLANLDVAKKFTPVRVLISGTTTTGAVNLTGAATLGTSELAEDAGFGKIVISEPGNYVLNGEFDEVVIAAEGVNVEIAEDAVVASLVIDAPAAAVTGEGTIKKATVNAPDATIEQKPEEIAVAEDVTVTIAEEELTSEDVTSYNNSNNTGGTVGGGGGYYIPPAETTVTVKDEADLREKLAEEKYSTIILDPSGNNFPIAKALDIKRAVTIDGNGKTVLIETDDLGQHTIGALGITANNVTIKNVTIKNNKDVSDNLIEIYGNNATLKDVTVENSEKAGIYVNQDGRNAETVTVTFENVKTDNNKYGGIGLVARKSGDKLVADFKGELTVNEPLTQVAVYVDALIEDGEDQYKGTVNVDSLKKLGYVKEVNTRGQILYKEDARLEISSANLFSNDKDNLQLDFTINQKIDLAQTASDIVIEYFYNGQAIKNDLAKDTGALENLTKNKTWSGYLWTPSGSYSIGTAKNAEYKDLVPAGPYSTVVKPDLAETVFEDGILKAGNYKVIITVKNQYGATVSTEATVTIDQPVNDNDEVNDGDED